ncbi:MAG: SOS response-associated peptidase [Thermomicrobiales bacterium]|nr:SOS response-associated peptidase [Thermomicrobiales bacterium]
MCGRYVIAGNIGLSERFEIRHMPRDLFEELSTYNAAPTQLLPVIIEDEAGDRSLVAMEWGLAPRWKPQPGKRSVAPINARAETLFEKPMFRNLTRAQRCIVPISGFYEWQRVGDHKQPYYITAEDGEAWGLAGLYDLTHEDEDAAGSFTIITTQANARMSALHERMPVILPRDAEADWLSLDVRDPGEVAQFLHAYPDDEMLVYPVSTAVNNTRNNGPQLIEEQE